MTPYKVISMASSVRGFKINVPKIQCLPSLLLVKQIFVLRNKLKVAGKMPMRNANSRAKILNSKQSWEMKGPKIWVELLS